MAYAITITYHTSGSLPTCSIRECKEKWLKKKGSRSYCDFRKLQKSWDNDYFTIQIYKWVIDTFTVFTLNYVSGREKYHTNHGDDDH